MRKILSFLSLVMPFCAANADDVWTYDAANHRFTNPERPTVITMTTEDGTLKKIALTNCVAGDFAHFADNSAGDVWKAYWNDQLVFSAQGTSLSAADLKNIGGGTIIDLYELKGAPTVENHTYDITDEALLEWVEWNKDNYMQQKGILLPQESKLRLDQVELTVSNWSTERLFKHFVGAYDKQRKFATMYVYDANGAYEGGVAQGSTAQQYFDECKELVMTHPDFVENGQLKPDYFVVATNISAALGTEIRIDDKVVMNVYDYVPTGGYDQTLNMKVRTNGAGKLAAGIEAGHFRNLRFNTIVIEGDVDAKDVHEVNIMGAGPHYLDLRGVTGLTNEQWQQGLSNFVNPNIEFIALPDNMTGSQVSASTFAKLISLGASGAFKAALSASTAPKGAVAYVNQPGTLHTAMAFRFGSSVWDPTGTHNTQQLTALTLAGQLNASDITASLNTNYTLGTDGHFHDVSEGVDASYSYALANEQTTLTAIDLENAVFATQTDMNFYAAGLMNLTDVKLPVASQMTLIADHCFDNQNSLSQICVPGNYTTIGASAFYENYANLTHIYTTEVDADGNGCYAAPIDHGPNTITLPVRLTSVATNAFGLDEKFTDVYLTSATVPTCELRAFSSGTVGGWDGFTAPTDGTANMSYYQQGTPDNAYFRSFAILHWPSDASDDDILKYTDVTRQYTYTDSDGRQRTDGTPYMWPTHEEFTTEHKNAIAGVLHDGTTTYDKTLYGGWHEFVLTDGTAPRQPLPVVKENDWYTLCLPFDMTKSELLTYYGDSNTKTYPKLVTLARVDRDKSSRHITLIMTDDLVAAEKTWNFGAFADGRSLKSLSTNDSGALTACYIDAVGDDPVLLEAGQPYFILPQLPPEKLAAGVAGVVSHVEKASKVAEPNKSYAVAAAHTGTNGVAVALDAADRLATEQGYDAEKPYVYHFTGTFKRLTVPENAYYLGRVKATGEHTLFRHTTTATKTWSQYGCIIGHVVAGELQKPMSYAIGETLTDDFMDAAGARLQTLFNINFYHTDVPTMVVEAVANRTAGRIGGVYNLNGQAVGTPRRGIYVVDGHKVIFR